jgi:ubiquinone/menaquinone biosynthesis C-methylase UbiE
MVVSRSLGDITFNGMSALFKVRDTILPRGKVLSEVGIEPGSTVLDFGCGPGGYVQPALELVGSSGKYYALDRNPQAIRRVDKLTASKALTNVKTIQSDCATDLPDASVDVVLLYDIFHMLDDPEGVLRELCRVLRPDGTLSVSDHHMKEEKIVSQVTSGGLFKLKSKGKKTFSFAPLS